MALAPLTWKLLGPSRPASTTGSNVISTIKEDFIVSSSFWTVVETANTGSTSLLLTPKFNDLTGSSAGRLHVVVANDLTSSDAYQKRHTNASANDRIDVGIVTDSGSFKDFQHTEPFGENKRWSKYYHMAPASSVSASFVLESEESLFFGFKDNSSASGSYGAYVGAILESFDSGSAERVTGSTGRRYGMMTSGPTAISTGFAAADNVFFGTTTATNSDAAGVFGASGSRKFKVWVELEKFTRIGTSDDTEYTTSENHEIGIPITMITENGVKEHMLGRVRGIFFYKHTSDLLEYKSGSTTVAYSVGFDYNASGDSLLFAPASGSVEAGVDFGGNG